MISRRPFLIRWLAGLAAGAAALPVVLAAGVAAPPPGAPAAASAASASAKPAVTSAARTAASAPAGALPPIVFVHGNGDTAALWTTTIWRFESNGWPRERLVALDLPYPQARDDDTKDQPGRSSTTEQRDHLAAQIDQVLAATGAKQLVLMGNSRGGLTIRNVIANAGAATKVSHVIQGGTPNHGVWALPSFRPGNEFNGAGPFLQGLNTLKGPDGLPLPEGADPSAGVEVTPGPKWLTIRSDSNDKFAQPDGAWIGAKDMKTQVTADGPALKGAENIVLPGRDHRETAFHPEAFAAAFRFITGREPKVDITPEDRVTLDGVVTGVQGPGPTNLPVPGARVEVYAVDPATGQRRGGPLVDKTVGDDGRWGPLVTDTRSTLEFVLKVPNPVFATTHIYRSPFARSSSLVHLRAERILAIDSTAGAIVTLARPRGYFGLPRDTIVFDGKSPPPGLQPGVAGAALNKLLLRDAQRSVTAEFRSGVLHEQLVGWAWPAADKHVSVLELHY
jgi:pimeloyl-ACP methyl ester carboxylesterase